MTPRTLKGKLDLRVHRACKHEKMCHDVLLQNMRRAIFNKAIIQVRTIRHPVACITGGITSGST